MAVLGSGGSTSNAAMKTLSSPMPLILEMSTRIGTT